MIILISGRQGSGKSTLAKGLYEKSRGPASIFKFADPLYELHNACLPIVKSWGLRPDTMTKDGELLQLLGTEYGRRCLGENVWVEVCKKRVETFLSVYHPSALVVIDDARFPNEMDAFPTALKIRLNADTHIRQERCSYWREDQTHPSEIGLDNYQGFDLIIDTGINTKQQTLEKIYEAAKNKKAY